MLGSALNFNRREIIPAQHKSQRFDPLMRVRVTTYKYLQTDCFNINDF